MPTDNVATTLITHGRVLAKVLREFETKQIPTVDIHEKVINATLQLLADLGGDSGFQVEEHHDKILRKVEWCLGEFTKHDSNNASSYGDLAVRVAELKSTGQSHYSHILPSGGIQDEYTVTNNSSSNLDDAYDSLPQADRVFLHLLCLLPCKAAINKQECFRWRFPLSEDWLTTNPGDDMYMYFNRKLTEFVEKGIIEVVAPVIRNRAHQKLRLKYRLTDMMRAKILPSNQINQHREHAQNLNSNSSFGGIYSSIVSRARAVLNVNEHMLDSKSYDWIFRMDDCVTECIHLGDWNDDPQSYIVVQDIDAMAKAMNNYQISLNLKSLSLRGVSGIVELPRVFYKLFYLELLNLRGCHNLESLPDRIQELGRLKVLDISECYLLNHIPKGIRELKRLIELKGFIIPQDEGPSLSKALLSDLSELECLTKLTLRTRRLNFPTNSDLEILCGLKHLTTLKVTWVGASSSNHPAAFHGPFPAAFSDDSKFPNKVEKFEIEAASKDTATRLLELIARQKDTSLKKLYIRGGDLSELVPNIECKALRLQYLPDLSLDCCQMMRAFPKLHRLEMSSDVISSLLRQSFKTATGSHDKAGNP